MHLDARAIELVFEHRLAEQRHGLVHIGRRVGEHRLDRLKRPEEEAREPGTAFGQRHARDGRQRAGQHRGAVPDAGRGKIRGPRDRVHEHPFEGALPQVAGNQPDDEILLDARRAGQQHS